MTTGKAFKTFESKIRISVRLLCKPHRLSALMDCSKENNIYMCRVYMEFETSFIGHHAQIRTDIGESRLTRLRSETN